MNFINVYEDAKRAEAYAKLEFPGTYYLAYRDLPAIIAEHVKGKKAIDFGCGTGRSTRFLQKLGFDAIGIDISADMINKAREIEKKVKIFKEIGRLLNRDGRIVNLVSSPDIYLHEWASFSTKDFPKNKYAKSGDIVKIIITAVDDKRPVEDIVWHDDAYREVFQKSELEAVKTYKPLAIENEPYQWINETRIAPWVIYVLKKKS